MIIPTNYTKDLNNLSEKDKLFILDYLEKNYTTDIFYNQEVMMTMKKIFSEMTYIYQALEPLENAGLDFTLSLVGGALRDLFTENYHLIKDLDIVLSINNVENYSKNNNVSTITNLENISEIQEQVQVCKSKYKEWDYWDIDKKIAALIEVSIAKNLNIKQTFIPLELPKHMEDNGIFRSNYHNVFLRGVVKIEDEKLRYPIDVLICNSTAKDYVNTFDFNICKIMLSITSEQFKKMSLNFNWDSLEQIKNEIIPTNDFWLDIVYKNLTLNPIGFDMNALERSIVEHLPRIQAKYPEYKLNLNKYNGSDLIQDDVKEYLNKMHDFIELNEKLPTKQDSRNIKPNKI